MPADIRHASPKKPAPMRNTGTETARSRKRTFPSAEGHRTRSGGQVSWLRILAAPRLPGYPVAINWSGSPLQWRDRAGFAALRDPTILKLPPQAAHRTSLLLPATRSTHPTRYEVWLRLYGRLARRSRWRSQSIEVPVVVMRTAPMTLQSRAKLNNNTEIPLLGLGVWQIPNGKPTADAVAWALEAGYRHVDTAKIYGNEEGVGEGIRNSGIPREEVWVTTKLWPTDQLNIRKAFDTSLAKLGIGYIDLYLVHWPTPGLVTRIWKAMEEIYKGGRCKAIGVSNHSISQLSAILGNAKIPPAVNQVKFSPFGFDQALLDFCAQHGIAIEAYSPLTKGERLQDSRLRTIAQQYQKSPAQILIRWALQKGTVVLPKSQNRDRLRENARVFDFAISAQDMDQLDRFAE